VRSLICACLLALGAGRPAWAEDHDGDYFGLVLGAGTAPECRRTARIGVHIEGTKMDVTDATTDATVLKLVIVWTGDAFDLRPNTGYDPKIRFGTGELLLDSLSFTTIGADCYDTYHLRRGHRPQAPG